MNFITLLIVFLVLASMISIFNFYCEMKKKQIEHELNKTKEVEKTKRLAILVQNLKVVSENPLSKKDIEDLIK